MRGLNVMGAHSVSIMSGMDDGRISLPMGLAEMAPLFVVVCTVVAYAAAVESLGLTKADGALVMGVAFSVGAAMFGARFLRGGHSHRAQGAALFIVTAVIMFVYGMVIL